MLEECVGDEELPNDKDQSLSPAFVALMNEHFQVAKYLVKEGLKAQSGTQIVDSLIHLAVVLENMDIIEFLFNLGANKNLQNSEGNTPLHLAYESRNLEIINQLINVRGCDQDIVNERGEKPVDMMLRKNEDEYEDEERDDNEEWNEDKGTEKGETRERLQKNVQETLNERTLDQIDALALQLPDEIILQVCAPSILTRFCKTQLFMGHTQGVHLPVPTRSL